MQIQKGMYTRKKKKTSKTSVKDLLNLRTEEVGNLIWPFLLIRHINSAGKIL